MKAPTRPTKPLRGDDAAYRQLWRLVDGAVADALKSHPDYLTRKGQINDSARRSITKRVVGAVLGYAGQTTRAKGRSAGSSPSAAATGDGHLSPSP